MVMKKAHELVQLCNTDVALIIHTYKDGHYYTYNSTSLKSWPLSREQIVSCYS